MRLDFVTVRRFGGVRRDIFDKFSTSNQFYGGQLGAVVQVASGKWGAEILAKVALGGKVHTVRIDGVIVLQPAGGSFSSSPGGLLALPSNGGQHRAGSFAAVPELGVVGGYQCMEQLRIRVGYTLLGWSSVALPGGQIDRQINPTQLPSFSGPGAIRIPQLPSFQFDRTAFWAQGFSVGIEYVF